MTEYHHKRPNNSFSNRKTKTLRRSAIEKGLMKKEDINKLLSLVPKEFRKIRKDFEKENFDVEAEE